MKVSPVPGSFPLGDLLEPAGKERLASLKLRSKLAAKSVVRKPDLPSLLELETEEAVVDEQQTEQSKVDMLALVIRLVMTAAEMYSEAEAYVEVFQPLLELMKALEASKIPKELKVSESTFNRLLTIAHLPVAYPDAMHRRDRRSHTQNQVRHPGSTTAFDADVQAYPHSVIHPQVRSALLRCFTQTPGSRCRTQ